MVDSLYHLISLLFFYFPLLYYCTIIFNLRLSIILCLSSGDVYFSLGISLSCSFATVSELFCCEFCEIFVILLSIKSLVASAAS